MVKKASKALTVSIVIPVYNEQSYIGACLDAIAAQTTRPDEVIVVDNNSTDRTVAIARKYPFVTVISEPNQGVLAARNRGFNISKGEVIGRIDADTVIPASWVSRIKENFVVPSIQVATGPTSYYDMPLPWLNFWLDHVARKLLNVAAPSCPFLIGSNMAIRRQAWYKVKPWLCDKTDMHEDLDLAVHLRQQGFSILYDKQLHSGASARRYEDSWPDFLHYGRMFRNSYYRHGIRSWAPRIVTSYYTLGYILLRPSRALYDPVTRQRSLRYALHHRREAARKNPMAH